MSASVLLAACGDGNGGTTAQAVLPGASPPAAGANSAPTITGTAPTAIEVGKAYTFQPSATDADNDKVSFVVANKPAWATFDAATGALSGTPSASHVGSYASIEISATDGEKVTSLPAFSITVSAAPSTAVAKAVTLEWQAPTENTDGTALADLRGYKIHYGTAPRTYSAEITLSNPSVTRYVVEALPSGKYYFALTALNASGHESAFTQEVSATLN